MKDNLDWTHHDSKTINENYYQVIEGTRSWGKTYTVNLFEKQLEEKDKEIDRLRNIIEEMDDYLEIAYASSGDDYQKAIKDVMNFFDILKEEKQ